MTGSSRNRLLETNCGQTIRRREWQRPSIGTIPMSNARCRQHRQRLNDITDTVGSAFMAMTYGCARCHTHKFDPILHTDYYRLQAFFANTAADDQISLSSAEETKRYEAGKAVWVEKTAPIRTQIAAVLEPAKAKIQKELFDKYPPEIQDAITKPAAQRNPFEWQMYAKAKPYMEIDDDQASKTLKGDAKKKFETLSLELKQFASLDPGEPAIGIGMHDLSSQSPATHRLSVGAWDAPEEEDTRPGFLSIIDSALRRLCRPQFLQEANRAGRVAGQPGQSSQLPWRWSCGSGLSLCGGIARRRATGMMGGRPARSGIAWTGWRRSLCEPAWDMKRMQKLMVTSETYRESSAFNAEARKKIQRRDSTFGGFRAKRAGRRKYSRCRCYWYLQPSHR